MYIHKRLLTLILNFIFDEMKKKYINISNHGETIYKLELPVYFKYSEDKERYIIIRKLRFFNNEC